MELKELIGLHKLSGIDNEMKTLTKSWDEEQTYDGQSITFVLDDVVYVGFEDDNDGYRSCMEEIKIGDFECKNRFEPIDVFCVYREKGSGNYETADLLDFYSIKSAKVILIIGTDNTSDYYPSFVADWQPANI